ncbi:hypothetical protein BGX31_007933 [Mortierella sp. GBA43]|nr:hypothetical protein BGX31_007933 [Mortierella sp. GBA43]
MLFHRALFAVLTIAACAAIQRVGASDASKSLTGSDFAAAITKGTTFVKFYSPQCAPTWEEVSVKHQGLEQEKGFKFAEVNCLIEGDVCHENNVRAYPSLQLFHNGKNVDVYSGDRSFSELSKFVKAKADEYSGVTMDTRRADTGPTPNSNGQVIVLDSKNYESALRDGQPWLIEYYAPWCGHCKALAPTYEKVAEALKGKVNVGKVDCPANEVICKSQKVRGYPTIKLHYHEQATEFKKQRSQEGLTSFALGATQPSVKPITLGDLQEIKNNAEVAFIYLHDTTTSKDITAVIEKQSQVFYEQISIYSAADPVIARQLSIATLPALVILKDERQYQFPGSLVDAKAVQSWMEQVKTPLVPLLTTSNANAALNAPGWVVLGLFDPSKPTTSSSRHELVEAAHTYTEGLASGRYQLIEGRSVRFAMLDATKWTNYIRSALGVEVLNLPVVLAVNSDREVYYPHASDGRRVPIEKAALLQYIADMETGDLTEQSMLSYSQRAIKHLSGQVSAVFGVVGNHPFLSVILAAALVYGLAKKAGAIGSEPRLDNLSKAD